MRQPSLSQPSKVTRTGPGPLPAALRLAPGPGRGPGVRGRGRADHGAEDLSENGKGHAAKGCLKGFERVGIVLTA